MRRFLLFLLPAFFLFLPACAPKPTTPTPTEKPTPTLAPTPVLEVNSIALSSYVLDVDYLGNANDALTVYANTEWTLTSDAPWVEVLTPSGDDTTEIQLRVAQNIGDDARTAILTVTGGISQTSTVLLTQNAAQHIYYKELAYGNTENTINVDQDGIEWLAATKGAYNKIEAYIDLSDVSGTWPEGVQSQGAPLYAYYAKPGIFDAGIYCNTESNHWFGFMSVEGTWYATGTHLTTNIVYLTIEVTADSVSYALYEVTDYGLDTETHEPMTFSGQVGSLPLHNDCTALPFYQMATIAFHEGNEFAINKSLRSGISLQGLRFRAATLYDSRGNAVPWNSAVIDAAVWGRTDFSVQSFTDNSEHGELSDITVTELTFGNGLTP